MKRLREQILESLQRLGSILGGGEVKKEEEEVKEVLNRLECENVRVTFDFSVVCQSRWGTDHQDIFVDLF